MERLDIEDDRFWKKLLVLGILLNLIACFTSDLGLDTHVKMAVDEDGALPWGDLRPESPGQSDAFDGGDRVVLPLYEMSEAGIKAMALVTFLGLIVCLYRWSGVRSATVLSLSPAMIFSVARGYEEVYLAAFAVLAMLLFSGVLSNKNRPLQCLSGGIFFMGMAYSKGFTGAQGVLLGAVLTGTAALLWHQLQNSGRKGTAWMARPHIVGMGVGLAVSMLMVFFGLLEINPTLAIIGQQPLRYASALAFSILDVVVIFTLFGMVMWPFVRSTWCVLKEVQDSKLAMITGYISGILVAVVFYVAALWTYEASIWGAEWPGVVWTMGNNGRYITMLFLPFIVLMHYVRKHNDVPSLDSPQSKVKATVLTVLLLLPFSLLASVHGQTMWTDEAAETMELGQDEHFLFVSEDTLGMHWLYTFYAPLDAEENNITGHWRSTSTAWEADLNASLSHVDTIVVSPEIKYTPIGWNVKTSGESDFPNGKGEWRVLTRS